MKKEPETVQCPKGKVTLKCTGCLHKEPHKKQFSCSISPKECSICEPVQTKPKNVIALLKSITHWDLIAQGLEESRGAKNCECCKQFMLRGIGCSDECLIKAKGHRACSNTPYAKVVNNLATKNQTPEALDAIEAEVEFLISCLPEPEQKAFSLENVQPFLRFGDKVWRNGEEFRFIRNSKLHPAHFVGFRPKTLSINTWSWFSVELFPPKPKPQLWETLEVGQPVWVWGRAVTKDRAFLRIFQAVSNMPSCLIKTTEFGFESNTCNWENFRLPTRAEAQKLGFDLNRWQWADDETQKGE